MQSQTENIDASLPPANAELETVLAAWHHATVRLERTHEVLREEVHRLTNELEVKNRELARKNRLADLGQMASHVAHEVRNHLVPVTLYLSLLRRRVSADGGAVDIADRIATAFTALDAMVHDLLNFTADQEPRLTRFSLDRTVEDVCTSLAPQLIAQAIDLRIDVPCGQVIQADESMVRRSVLNLVLNALDAMPEGGALFLTSLNTASGVELEIADTGPGLSEEARRRACEPFFSTKEGGTGLGLAIVHRIAEVHGGSVCVANCPEGGAAVTLRFPHAISLEAAA
ncbi:MAG: HAMP domain-containing sensor histidine kinase, partial [Patescibacteria group bacterium]|nr:HAMP domain-containing sensor histidine kinase [Patescibacteria group bacterium]